MLEHKQSKPLTQLPTGSHGIIYHVGGQGAFRKRISEMGFVKGQRIRVVKNAPLKDPVEYEIMGYKVSLRRSEAALVEVVPPNTTYEQIHGEFEGTIDEKRLKTTGTKKGKIIRVALVGNPNSGKTTLFNYVSGSKEKVGNFAGVTVDIKEAQFKVKPYTFLISDLPGTYSITEYSPEELFVRNNILQNRPDVIINIVDASNLKRNLFLTTQLIDMNVKVVLALNMYDELEQKKDKIDYVHLGEMMGIPIIPTVAKKGKGLKELFDRIIEVYEERDPVVRHIHINYGSEIEKSIHAIQTEIRKDQDRDRNYSTRYLSIKLLEKDNEIISLMRSNTNIDNIISISDNEIKRLELMMGDASETLIADAKYGFIAGALHETYKTGAEDLRDQSQQIDKMLTHKYLGFPFFVFFIWITFQATFTIGQYPMDWMDAGISWIGNMIGSLMPEGPLKALIIDGIIGGVGGVIIFLPNIMILFFFISLMEDSGYMARAVFLMDKLMHKMGLHGKSFIPLIMGFGCNVPAIMATRTLENRNDRLLTMLITPLMSCSARLPVYILLISAFFPDNPGNILFLIYGTGVFLAILMGLAFRKILFSSKEAPFVMELPPYRKPTLKNTIIHMWQKGSQYLRKMGTVILFASILIWALGHYPRNVEFSRDYETLISIVETNPDLADKQKEEQVTQLKIQQGEERMEQSYIGRIGKFIEPAIRPLGFDWKIGVSIVTGMAAKEIVVGSMGVLYQAGIDEDETSVALIRKIQEQTYTEGSKAGQKVFSPLVALTMMIFVLIYFPCIAVIAAVKKEGNWEWAFFTMFYTTALAWIVAFVVYNIGSLFI